jgi:hypothetical protein
MRDFYIEVVIMMDKYEVTKSNQELCIQMAGKNQDVSCVGLILDELKPNSLDFDRLCNDVSEIQRLTQSRNIVCGY